MFKFFEKQSFLVILLVIGLLLIVLSIFDPNDITKLQVEVRTSYVWPAMLIGIFLSLVSLLLYVQERTILGWFNAVSVKGNSNTLQAKLLQSRVNIHFGRIQDLASELDTNLIVLPANEYFDDECINDDKSSLGAYIQNKFPNLTINIEGLIKEELKKLPSTKVEKKQGVVQSSFGIGAGVYLGNPLGSEQPVLLLSVTTKRSGEGLRAEMSHIFKAIKKTQQIAADNRISSVCIPVMGTGHGGLKSEVGLFALVLAICDVVSKPSGHHIKDYNIVVYRESSEANPSISFRTSKRILKTAIGVFS